MPITSKIIRYHRAYVMGCEKSKREWEQITKIYRKNKKKRELAEINIQDQKKIIQESRKMNKIRNTKEKEKCKKVSRKSRQKIERQKIQKRRIG